MLTVRGACSVGGTDLGSLVTSAPAPPLAGARSEDSAGGKPATPLLPSGAAKKGGFMFKTVIVLLGTTAPFGGILRVDHANLGGGASLYARGVETATFDMFRNIRP